VRRENHTHETDEHQLSHSLLGSTSMSWLSTARPRTPSLLSIVLLLLVTAARLLDAKLFECAVGRDSIPAVSTSSTAGDVVPAGVSTAAVALAVTALQTAGVQVRCCRVLIASMLCMSSKLHRSAQVSQQCPPNSASHSPTDCAVHTWLVCGLAGQAEAVLFVTSRQVVNYVGKCNSRCMQTVAVGCCSCSSCR
jgi:hypothetical protein